MMPLEKVFIAIILTSFATYFTRIFPFLFFINREPPPLVVYLEKNIPPMIMVILILYSIKDILWTTAPFGLPEILCAVIVFILHIWKKNPLISIFPPTILYMYLIQSGVTKDILSSIIQFF